MTCNVLSGMLNRTIPYHSYESEKLVDPRESRMMPPPGLQIYLQSRVTMTFDLNLGCFMPLPHGPLVLIGIKIR